MSDIYVTRAFFHEMHEKLEKLKKDSIKISGQIEEARLQGDLSENAEYDAAKEAQAYNAAQQKDLESKIAFSKIIEEQNIVSDKIFIGALAKLKDLDKNKEVEYMFLSQEESNFEENKVSILSPIGKGLLGKSEGDEVEITVPSGKLHYKVLKITRPL